MDKKIITISREFGSGGRTIAKQLAERLGIPYYDQELILELAKKSGFSEDYVKEESEYTPGGLFSSVLAARDMGLTNQDKLWNIQKEIILSLAQKGSCVIVGRCADYILRDTEKCLNVFIHASMEKRANRIVSVYGEREQSPMQRLCDKDKRRATYYKFYTDVKWGVARNYHISLDSGELGIDYCVNCLAEMATHYFAE